jgi:tetratricopeptide (TPR) repeat protein
VRKASGWVCLLIVAGLGALLGAETTDLDFADSLFQEKDYYRAIGFYKRFVFFNKSSPRVSGVNYRIGLCYQKGRQTDPAIESFLKVPLTDPLADESRFQIGYTKYAAGYYVHASADLDRFAADFPSSPLRGEAKYLSGLACVNDQKWEEAAVRFEDLWRDGPDGAYRTAGSNLAALCRQGLRLPKKSAVAAGLLSALVPGLGQVYCDRYLDGLSSFLLTGSLGAVTVAAAVEPGIDDAYAYVAGAFFVIFYASNVYGAVNAAQNGTLIIRENFKNHVLKTAPKPGEVSVDLTWTRPL